MSTNIVQIENLVKRYGDLVALDHLNLSISEGEIFGLLGPNGSGKTTAINCMLSLLKYDKGSIHIFGEEMRPDNYKVKQQIGIVLQNVAVFDELTVYENIDYFCGLYVPGLYQLCIEDNGKDAFYDPEKSGIGIVNMKERVNALGGTLQIFTDKGFRIFITIPKCG